MVFVKFILNIHLIFISVRTCVCGGDFPEETGGVNCAVRRVVREEYRIKTKRSVLKYGTDVNLIYKNKIVGVEVRLTYETETHRVSDLVIDRRIDEFLKKKLFF